MASPPVDIRPRDVLSEVQLDDFVHHLQRRALAAGMIPIAAVISAQRSDGGHEILGFGCNRLRQGTPGIHGETGALMHLGRRPGGYRQLTITSSLSPCPFCQQTLACHLGIGAVRILDASNYRPDFSGYARVGISPVVAEHPGIVSTFGQWLDDPANAVVWDRDSGLWPGPTAPVFDIPANPRRLRQILAVVHQTAAAGLEHGEAPIGAAVVDPAGEVIGAGHARIQMQDDPSCVASMAAWRACGGRDQWRDKTLLLSAGPDAIAASMFTVFGFGQLVIASDAVFAGHADDVRALSIPVHVLNDSASDTALRNWIGQTPLDVVREYLGVEFA